MYKTGMICWTFLQVSMPPCRFKNMFKICYSARYERIDCATFLAYLCIVKLILKYYKKDTSLKYWKVTFFTVNSHNKIFFLSFII